MEEALIRWDDPDYVWWDSRCLVFLRLHWHAIHLPTVAEFLAAMCFEKSQREFRQQMGSIVPSHLAASAVERSATPYSAQYMLVQLPALLQAHPHSSQLMVNCVRSFPSLRPWFLRLHCQPPFFGEYLYQCCLRYSGLRLSPHFVRLLVPTILLQWAADPSLTENGNDTGNDTDGSGVSNKWEAMLETIVAGSAGYGQAFSTGRRSTPHFAVQLSADLPESVYSEFEKYHYVPGLLMVHVSAKKWSAALDLALREKYDRYFLAICQQLTENSDWRSALDAALRLRRQAQLNDWSATVYAPWPATPDVVVLHMAAVMGMPFVLTFLKAETWCVGSISSRCALRLGIVNRVMLEESVQDLAMAEVMDAYLWRERSGEIPAQLRSLLLQPSRGSPSSNTNSGGGDSLRLVQSLQMQWMQEGEEVSRKLQGGPERIRAGWGFRLSSPFYCGSCQMLLQEKDRTLVAFRCGHVFHDACLPEDACSVCFQSAAL